MLPPEIEKENVTNDDRVLALLRRVGLTTEQARRALEVAKLKVEAASMVGVAGFWS